MSQEPSKHRIAIFGGTFDPFTIAHKAIVDEVLDRGLVDEVIISPTIVNWHRKGKDVWLSDTDKLRVISKCFPTKKYPNVTVNIRDIVKVDVVSNFPELKSEFVENQRFIHTLVDLIVTYPDVNIEWYVIIGSDSLAMFKQWHMWESILKIAKLIVVNGREGEHVDSDIPHTEITLPSKYENVSATKIREKFASKKTGVNLYINELMSIINPKELKKEAV